MNKTLATLLILLAFLGFTLTSSIRSATPPVTKPSPAAVATPVARPVKGKPASSDQILEQLFASQRSDVQVAGQGRVIKVLDDDDEGSRHQRFVIRLGSGQTLLIAHNIDLAPRVADLEVGSLITFCGVYEWSAKGGTVHWTHHDPQRRHRPAGLNSTVNSSSNTRPRQENPP